MKQDTAEQREKMNKNDRARLPDPRPPPLSPLDVSGGPPTWPTFSPSWLATANGDVLGAGAKAGRPSEAFGLPLNTFPSSTAAPPFNSAFPSPGITASPARPNFFPLPSSAVDVPGPAVGGPAPARPWTPSASFPSSGLGQDARAPFRTGKTPTDPQRATDPSERRAGAAGRSHHSFAPVADTADRVRLYKPA